MSPRGAQSMVGDIQDVGNSVTLNRYAEVRAGRCKRMAKTQNSSEHMPR